MKTVTLWKQLLFQSAWDSILEISKLFHTTLDSCQKILFWVNFFCSSVTFQPYSEPFHIYSRYSWFYSQILWKKQTIASSRTTRDAYRLVWFFVFDVITWKYFVHFTLTKFWQRKWRLIVVKQFRKDFPTAYTHSANSKTKVVKTTMNCHTGASLKNDQSAL